MMSSKKREITSGSAQEHLSTLPPCLDRFTSQKLYSIMILALPGLSLVRSALTNRSSADLLRLCSPLSFVRSISSISHQLTYRRPPREEKGYGKDELDLKIVDLCGSSSGLSSIS
jgi:hypothetical protein